MGMSASQARFLSLTARKTNVEYEGQQINQQRTTLSNESANYYSQLTSMSVPIPPSTEDYTKITYTFENGTEKNTVTSIVATKTTKDDGIYMLNYVQEIPADNMVVSGTNVISKTDSGYYIGKVQLQDASNVQNAIQGADDKYYVPDKKKDARYDDTKGQYYIIVSPNTTEEAARKMIVPELGGKEVSIVKAGSSWLYYFGANDVDSEGQYQSYKEVTPAQAGVVDDETRESIVSRFIAGGVPTEVANSYSNAELAAKLKVESQYRALAAEKYAEDDWYVRYVANSSTGNYEPVFYSKSETDRIDYNEKTSLSLGGVRAYMFGQTTESKEIKNAEALVEKDASGRYQALFIYNDSSHTSGTRYELTTTTETDDNAYNDAMNQYYYDKAIYDQKVEEVNAKIGIIQVQDKNLELKLKQLDTEENAISTEMDAVKKVISKNVESSFKTFNA